MNQAQIYDMTPLISESFLNGKKNLTQYYIGQVWRFTGQVQGLFVGILIIVYFALPSAFTAIGITNYMAAIPFFIPSLIPQILQPYISLADQINNGANRPYFLVQLRYFETAWAAFLCLFLYCNFSITTALWIARYLLDLSMCGNVSHYDY